MKMKIEPQKIIEAYQNGESLNSVADKFNTYATTIRRILIKNKIELRHDRKEKNGVYIKDGEKLLEWAKSQDRLVTKTELAAVVGKAKLSHSYFRKYPELGRYVKNHNNNNLKTYTNKLIDWLTSNNIPYKPSDRTKLGVSVDFLLLEEYSNIALQIYIRPRNVSSTVHKQKMELKRKRAADAGVNLIFLTEDNFKELDKLKIIFRELIKK